MLLTPSGKGNSPRLRVTYCVNADRWLCVTMHDLLGKLDMRVKDQVMRL